ncbi:MAG: porin family protein [Bacteroidales bacterium]|nr:porin family protein [Bacteroidales bacterium]
MKKIILVVLALIAAYNMNAQSNDSRDNLQLGVKGGLNYSNVYDTQGDEFKADGRFGMVLGGFLSIPIGRFLGIQPELLFSQKGFQGTGSVLGSPYSFNRTTNYIDIPILVQLKASEQFTIVAGPQYSFLIKQSDVFSNSILTTQQEQEFTNDNIRKNTLCFLGGLDVNFDRLVVGGRVGWDFLNNNGDGTSATPRYKNVWSQLTLGYKF